MSKVTRREFVTTAMVGAMATPALIASADPSGSQAADDGVRVGPFVGHVDAECAMLWYRSGCEGSFTAVLHLNGDEVGRQAAAARAENDFCLRWRFDGLKPVTRYRYQILQGDATIVADSDCYLVTGPSLEDGAKVCLAFGSCAKIEPLALWSQMEEQGAQGIVLLGDTPYIDSTNLEIARQKHRNFVAIPQFAAVIRHTPMWGTWDDHDFGVNDSSGTLPGKEHTRRAFAEYRANATCGHEGEGIYTRFRLGPVEVFLLDTRWFADTEPSPVAPDKPTLLGKQQWEWLKKGLKESDATFKVIACGMIWDDKENRERDDWGTYTHERSALFDFLGEEQISGVLLMGGDIHCSRLLRYNTEKQVGYPLYQCIVSPIHSSTIPSLNVAHRDLIRGEAVPHVWLRLTADSTQSPAVLHAEWVQMNGQEMWDLRLTEDEMRAS
jgi:alkaline phosphatase D